LRVTCKHDCSHFQMTTWMLHICILSECRRVLGQGHNACRINRMIRSGLCSWITTREWLWLLFTVWSLEHWMLHGQCHSWWMLHTHCMTRVQRGNHKGNLEVIKRENVHIFANRKAHNVENRIKVKHTHRATRPFSRHMFDCALKGSSILRRTTESPLDKNTRMD